MSDREAALRRIWSEVLSLEQVGVDDDFFDLGGDSVLVLEMLTRASEAGVDLALDRLGEFLEESTCARLLALARTGTAPHQSG